MSCYVFSGRLGAATEKATTSEPASTRRAVTIELTGKNEAATQEHAVDIMLNVTADKILNQGYSRREESAPRGREHMIPYSAHKVLTMGSIHMDILLL